MKTLFQQFFLKMAGLTLADEDPDIASDRAQSDAIREKANGFTVERRPEGRQSMEEIQRGFAARRHVGG